MRPVLPFAARLKKNTAMCVAISGVKKVSNKYLARKMFDEGVATYIKRDFKKSVYLFGKAIRYDSTLALFYVSRGAARLKLARAREAIEDFDRAIALDAGYARAYHLRGIAHEQMGSFARAFQDFDRALEIDPEYGAAYPSRESMLSNPKQPDPALEEFEMTNHLMAMRLTDFNKKVPSDLAI
jgi:tetratricopeptide (TPR) repeat protein